MFDISVRTHDKAHATAVTPGEKLIAVMLFTVSCMPIFNVTDTFKQLVDVFTLFINRGELAKDSRLLHEAFVVTDHCISSSLQQEYLTALRDMLFVLTVKCRQDRLDSSDNKNAQNKNQFNIDFSKISRILDLRFFIVTLLSFSISSFKQCLYINVLIGFC